MLDNIQHKARQIKVAVTITLALLLAMLFLLTLRTTIRANPLLGNLAAIAQAGTITGRVTASDGGNLGPLRVIARGVSSTTTATESTLDTSGRYTLTGLPSGTYRVTFNPGSEGPYLSEHYNDKRSFDTLDPVPVTDGATTSDIDAELQLGGIITGQVTAGNSGAPLAGIRVDVDGINTGYDNETVSDAAGFYTVTTLPTDNYEVRFLGSESYAGEFYDNKPTRDLATPVAVTESMTTTDINAALTFILNITGHVEAALSHEPIPNVTVAVYNPEGEWQMSASTDATGDYIITALPPGSYRVRFSHDDYLPQYYSNRILFEEADWITVTAGIAVSNINALLNERQESELTVASTSTRSAALLAARRGRFGTIYSQDGGQSWQTFATLPFAVAPDAPQIAITPHDDPAQPLRFLLAKTRASAGGEGIYYSDDAGASWSRFVPAPDPRCAEGARHDVEILITSPADPLRAYAMTKCFKTELNIEPRPVPYRNLHSSADGGVNWQLVTMPPANDESITNLIDHDFLLPSPVDPARTYAWYRVSAPGKFWQRSDNHGQTWASEAFTLTALALDWTSAEKLYGVEDSAADHLFDTGGSNAFRYTGKRSVNGGDSWTDWPQQPCRASFIQLLSLPAADTLLMLCDQGLLRSENGGDSWEMISSQSDGTLTAHSGDHQLILWVRGSEL